MLKTIAMAGVATLAGFAAWADSHETAADSSESSEEMPAVDDVDLAAAEGIFKRNCSACHGNKAQGVASYPKLSDKTPEYITDKLETYRAGERIGPNSILMIQNAKDLSDEDIANLSVYVTTAFD